MYFNDERKLKFDAYQLSGNFVSVVLDQEEKRGNMGLHIIKHLFFSKEEEEQQNGTEDSSWTSPKQDFCSLNHFIWFELGSILGILAIEKYVLFIDYQLGEKSSLKNFLQT